MKQPCSKRFFLPLLLIIALLTGLSLGMYSNHLDRRKNQAFTDYTNELFRRELSENTLNLHYTLADPEAFGISPSTPSLGNVGTSDSQQRFASLKEMQQQVKALSSYRLTQENQIALDTLQLTLAAELSLEGLELLEEPLSPSLGIQAQLPVLLAEYTFRTHQDIEDYLGLLSSIDTYFQKILDFEQEKAAQGLFMSDTSVDRIIQQCSSFIAEPEDNYLSDIFMEKLSDFSDLSTQEITAYENRHQKALQEHLIPAYQLLIEGLETLKGTGNNENGLCYLPGGKDYYCYLLRSDAGLYDSPDQLRDRLIRQLTNDITEMRTLLSENPQLLTVSQNLVSSCQTPEEILEELQTKMQKDFPISEKTSYQIKYVHPDLEEYLSPAFYLTPPIDTLSPNAIYINPSSAMEGISLYTTLAHEGFPGHLYQTLYFSSSEPPLIRHLLGNSGYVEGWATYIESYAYGYAGDNPEASRLLWLNRSLNLCLCSLLDMGIHYYGWTLEEATEFFERFGITDQNSVSEIFQYTLETPGNYLKYYLGYLKFLDLKEELQRELGKRFDLKEFHEAVLTVGPCQFPVLEKYVKERMKI